MGISILWRYTTCTNIHWASIVYILLVEELRVFSLWRMIEHLIYLYVLSLVSLQDPRSLSQDDEVIMLF